MYLQIKVMILKMWEKSLKLHLNMIFGIWFEMSLHWSRLSQVAASLFTCLSSKNDLIWIFFSILLNGNESNSNCIDNWQDVCTCTCTCTSTWNIHHYQKNRLNTAAQLFVWYQLLLNIWLSTFCILHFSFYRIILYFFISKQWKINSAPIQWQYLNYRFQFHVQQLDVMPQDGKPARQMRKSWKRSRGIYKKMVNCSLVRHHNSTILFVIVWIVYCAFSAFSSLWFNQFLFQVSFGFVFIPNRSESFHSINLNEPISLR